MIPFQGCGAKSIAPFGLIQFDRTRSHPHGIVKKIFRYEPGVQRRGLRRWKFESHHSINVLQSHGYE